MNQVFDPLLSAVALAAMSAPNLMVLARTVSNALTEYPNIRSVDFVWRDRAPKLSATHTLELSADGASMGEVHIACGEGQPLDSATLAGLQVILSLSVRNLQLVERVASLSKRAHQRNRELGRRLRLSELTPHLVAVSTKMREAITAAELVAPHPATVLIRGESGTGKELLARHVHRSSLRSSGPFVAVNCGALPETMIESELFGHERGAFTGAIAARRGRFELASGGTLFLDEIGDLNLSSQVKLLRVLQEGTLERLGSERSITVNVRVIAATHRDLESMVRAGTFREDLFFRLNVFPIQIAPLRERPEDVPELARRKLKRLAERSALPLPTLPKEAMTRLARHDWPGNVRELENVVERCFIRSRGGRLRVPDLSSPPPSLAAPPAQVGTLADCIREHIENALTRSRGKIYGDDGAAQALGLKPSTLQTKMRKHGIRRESFVSGVGSDRRQ
ncbi:MAG: sigma-54 interaction domain-containing protein [Polyangiales bacterium]